MDRIARDGLGGFLHAGILEEPLHRDARLDRDVGALAVADVVLVVLDLHELAHRLELLGGLDAGVEAVHALEVGDRRGR